MESDLLNFNEAAQELINFEPDLIVHLAARTEVEKSFYEQISFSEVNYVGTVNLIEAANKLTKKPVFLFASTMEVYGWQPVSNQIQQGNIPDVIPAFDETTIPNPNAPYAVAKFACEKYLEYAHRAYGLEYIIIRQTNCYGRKDNDFFVTEQIISQMLKNKDECNLGYGTPYRNFIYIDDLIDAWIAVIDNKDKCVNNIFTMGPNYPVQIEQHAKNIAGLLNWTGKINWNTKPKRHGEIYLLNSNNDKLTKFTNWDHKVDYWSGLKQTVEFWKQKKTITILDHSEYTNWNVDNTILSLDKFWVGSKLNKTPEFVSITRNYIKQYNIEYKLSTFENIDKSRPWLIFTSGEFIFNIHFLDKEQLANKQLFQGIPDNIIHELVNGNAYLIISCEQEAFTNSFFDIFYSLYKNNPAIPTNKIIHITAARNIHELYNEYCLKNNIPHEEKIQIWYSYYSLLGPINHNLNLYTPTPTKKTKKFINFNRVPRSHRITFTSLLAEYDLLDQGYVSLGIDENPIFKNRSTFVYHVQHHLPRYYNWNVKEDLYKFTIPGCQKLVNKLPLTIDTDKFDYRPSFAYSGKLMKFYDTCYFSVVSNTYFFAKDELGITLNEKEFKPILARHPFILIARPRTLALLKELGFKTFSQWFDESYDEEKDDSKRMVKIINEVDRLCKIDNNTWDAMLEEMKPVLEYNYNWIVNNTNDIIFNFTEFKNILKYAV